MNTTLVRRPPYPSANIGTALTESARRMPAAVAVVSPRRRRRGPRAYDTITFRELEEDSNQLAAGLQDAGLVPGMRVVLLVRPGIDFVSLVFALFKAGAVTVLIDPGMGRARVLQCLQEVRPDGLIGIPAAHALRTVFRGRFPRLRLKVTVGRRWFWRGPTIGQFRARTPRRFKPVAVSADDPASIIFTSGSTGPPKGVLYEHGNFLAQVEEIRDHYGIESGEVDLSAFPLFGLFNAAMGVTSVIPDMDPARPALVDPRNIVDAVCDWKATQAFGSPAIWNVVGPYCQRHGIRMPTLRRVLSAGAPVPSHVLRRMSSVIHPEGEVHTPYGATEALPVASISAREVLDETARRSAQGGGTCVGTRFPRIQWRVIPIEDGPVADAGQIADVPRGQIGELIVRGPVVTRCYVTRTAANASSKIADNDGQWHRMGDVGYLDDRERFWFCGRKAHRVSTANGPMFTIPCEAVFNQHQQIFRSALVGIGPRGVQTPVMVVEPWPGRAPGTSKEENTLIGQLAELAQSNPLTQRIDRRHILIHPSLPVDVRHNAKILREKLAVWAKARR
jgi:acyl-CoA synthetase (AMP-forming)/AMP-acid ligase II